MSIIPNFPQDYKDSLNTMWEVRSALRAQPSILKEGLLKILVSTDDRGKNRELFAGQAFQHLLYEQLEEGQNLPRLSWRTFSEIRHLKRSGYESLRRKIEEIVTDDTIYYVAHDISRFGRYDAEEARMFNNVLFTYIWMDESLVEQNLAPYKVEFNKHF